MLFFSLPHPQPRPLPLPLAPRPPCPPDTPPVSSLNAWSQLSCSPWIGYQCWWHEDRFLIGAGHLESLPTNLLNLQWKNSWWRRRWRGRWRPRSHPSSRLGVSEEQILRYLKYLFIMLSSQILKCYWPDKSDCSNVVSVPSLASSVVSSDTSPSLSWSMVSSSTSLSASVSLVTTSGSKSLLLLGLCTIWY